MKRLFLLTAVVLAPLLVPRPAAAHVLLVDNAAGASAVLHITPNDDPEAGKTSRLYFDLQTKQPTDLNGYSLYVARNGQTIGSVPARPTANNILQTDFTFPAQDLYNLEIRQASSTAGGFTLRSSLRVSRGAVGTGVQRPSRPVASLAAISSGVALVLLVIVYSNNRSRIAQKSTL